MAARKNPIGWITSVAFSLGMTTVLLTLISGPGHQLGYFSARQAVTYFSWASVMALSTVSLSAIGLFLAFATKAPRTRQIFAGIGLLLGLTVLLPSQIIKRETRDPQIEPVVMASSKPQAFARALEEARSIGWDVVGADEETGRIDAIDTAPFFGIKEEVVIQVTESSPNQSHVDVRSFAQSSDETLGTVIFRVRGFLDRLRHSESK